MQRVNLIDLVKSFSNAYLIFEQRPCSNEHMVVKFQIWLRCSRVSSPVQSENESSRFCQGLLRQLDRLSWGKLRHLAASSFSAGHDLTGSRTLVEYTWSIIFGRNPQDIPPDQKFFCSWFETRTQAEVAATNLARCKQTGTYDMGGGAELAQLPPSSHLQLIRSPVLCGAVNLFSVSTRSFP